MLLVIDGCKYFNTDRNDCYRENDKKKHVKADLHFRQFIPFNYFRFKMCAESVTKKNENDIHEFVNYK